MKFTKPSFNKIDPKALTTFISTVYLIVFFLIYPLFMKSGYVNISYDKYTFFIYSSLVAILLLLVTGLFLLFRELNRILITDFFVLIFILLSTISFLLSSYRQDGLNSVLGAEGWYMGYLTILVMCVLYFLISRLWLFEKIVVYAIFIGSFLVYLLGILDRYSLYIIPLEVRNSSFISTLGNINWFMGFYSVITPLGVVLFLLELKKSHENGTISLNAKLLAVYVFVAFLAGFAQGSDGIVLFDAALFVCILCLVRSRRIYLEHSCLVFLMWALSQIIFVLMMHFPGLDYNYDISGIYRLLTNIYIAPIVVVLVLLTYLFIRNKVRKGHDVSITKKRMAGVVLGIFFSLIVLWLVVCIINTNTGFIDENSGYLTFDRHFASGRGETMWAGTEAFKNSGVREKLIGAGPDMFDLKVYSIESVSSELKRVWPNDRLTNAHSEILTILVNQGILGIITYIGIFISYILLIFKGSKNVSKKDIPGFSLAVAVSVICYLSHNLMSFSQILSTPFIFIIMGMGVSAVHKNNSTGE